MTKSAAGNSAVLTAQDSLILASMASPVETELVMDWVGQQRAGNPEAKFEVVALPRRDAPPTALTALAEELESGEDRSVVPVRVFWLPSAESGTRTGASCSSPYEFQALQSGQRPSHFGDWAPHSLQEKTAAFLAT